MTDNEPLDRDLPPLPEPKIATAWLDYSTGEKACPAYTADQIQAKPEQAAWPGGPAYL